MKMQFGVLFCYGPLIILWILFFEVAHARHIQMATQRNRAQSRPRLLIIRPPEGSGQPNRIVVLANSRPKPTNASPSLSTAITALQETSAAAKAGLDRAFGGHPQSVALQQARSGGRTASKQPSSASKASTVDSSKKDSASPLSQSLRGILRRRSQVHKHHGTVDKNRQNIVRGFPNMPPRAAAPVVPQAKSMGRLNMPEKLQRRLQEQAKNRPNLRQSNIQAPYNHHEHMGGRAPVAAPSSPFHGGVIDLSTVSLHDRAQSPDATSGDASRTSGANLRWDIGTLRTPGNLGRNGISRAGTGSWNQKQTSGTRKDNNDLLRMPTEQRRGVQNSVRKTGSNLRTFQDQANKAGLSKVPAPSTVNLQAMLRDSVKPKGSFDLSNTVGVGQTSVQGAATPMTSKQPMPPIEKSATGSILAASGARDSGKGRFQMNHAIPAPPSINPPTSVVPGGSLKLKATANLTSSSAETNSTSNTTNTKSVKTKKVKITTTVKGGTQADVAAAAASQAEIANAVAQGKEINSSALANLAKAASGATTANAPAKNTPPVGSITVKRQPNGESIITLSDGQGEPVVLRATGPVKIERIVKPNGRVQFLINPLNRPPTTAAVVDTTAAVVEPPTPAVVDLSELEIGEEFTTTTDMTSTGLWSTSTPFYVDPSSAATASTTGPLFEPTGKSLSEPGIKSTIEVTSNTNTSSSSTSQNSTTVTKNRTRTITANTEKNGGIMQLFPSQKIPPPPKLSGMAFGNSGLFNPFFLDTNNFLQNSGFSLGANEAVQSSGSTKVPSAKGTDKAPLQLFPDAGTGQPLKQTRGQSSGSMPQYELLGVTPSLQFVPSGKVVP